MAMQLIENRSPAAYAGVTRWAASHQGEAGALAWLVIGYARILDRQFDPAIEALKRSRPQAGELADYVDFFLATCHDGLEKPEQVAATLRNFETSYPQSLYLRDAVVLHAKALVALGQAQQSIGLLEAHRLPTRANVELALGRAYEAAGQPARAADTLRHLYVTMPASQEAQDAEFELQSLFLRAGLPPLTYEERKTRASRLVQAGRHSQAAEEYRELLKQAPAEEADQVRVWLAWTLWKSAREREAEDILKKMPDRGDEPGAQRLYILLELERPDEDEVEKLLTKLRATTPQSPWFQEGLLAAANTYVLKRDAARAAALFYELQQRFPKSRYAAYAHWKAAWLTFRQGKRDDAANLFEKQIEIYPASAEVMPALYWRARLAEEDGNKPKARAYYHKLGDRFRQYYYADLARERLGALANPGTAAPEPLLERIPQLQGPNALEQTEVPDDNLRAQKSLLLENGALYELALRELEAAASDGGVGWALARMAQLHRANGRNDRALQTLKRAIPGYFALDLGHLPRVLWEELFPRPYWDDVKRFSLENKLDPFLVAALVRQESEFNPVAISRANAIGLMQLLPTTGKRMARQVKLRGYSTLALTAPRTNLQLGTRYFRQLIEKFDGTLEYALAAYNAGPDRVDDWLSNGPYRDLPEFVESIPYTETREYVQAVVRNANIYRRLYGSPEVTSSWAAIGRKK
ncbi:MAG TPA: transglycosylase SLT domain-containing protein [Terriglobales bacterium]|nr:transglycosylase SLT domain-containing protein [Terriglobales bacterium]